MSLSDVIQILERRGTRTSGALDSDVEALTARLGRGVPKAVLELLRIQNGENQIITFEKGYRLMAAAEIAESMDCLKAMVEIDETLPQLFLEFVPFMHTEVKTDVGVFWPARASSPKGVVEYHYETGEFVQWSDQIESFIGLLASCESPYDMLGKQFPVPQLKLVDITSFSWE